VGTGFHPELTGRENIFLNGAILGMRRAEIIRKFDEIVTFAEIEKFLDTPVKRYSSGMYVRLAFAVAAHLEPEILIVDEVLAVGDAQFQKKCLGKMEEVSAKEGRTVLFVSHNMPAIETICTSAFYLKMGKMHKSGPTNQVVREYMHDMKDSASLKVCDREDRVGRGMVILRDLETTNAGGTKNYAIGDDICLKLLVENKYAQEVTVRLSVSIRHGSDFALISCDTAMIAEKIKINGNSLTTVTCRIFSPPLNYGEYFINTSILCNDETEDWIPSAGNFIIESGKFHNHVRHFPFPVLARFEWKLDEYFNG
jgi:lipopolysaccharide transport system ATP-binding protein